MTAYSMNRKSLLLKFARFGGLSCEYDYDNDKLITNSCDIVKACLWAVVFTVVLLFIFFLFVATPAVFFYDLIVCQPKAVVCLKAMMDSKDASIGGIGLCIVEIYVTLAVLGLIAFLFNMMKYHLYERSKNSENKTTASIGLITRSWLDRVCIKIELK